jgi:hypothetical protein
MSKKNQAVRFVEVPGETADAPPIHGIYAQNLRLIPRLRYPMAEAAWLLAISERYLRYRVDAGDIVPVYDGDKPLFTIQELQRYASRSHLSMKLHAEEAHT